MKHETFCNPVWVTFLSESEDVFYYNVDSSMTSWSLSEDLESETFAVAKLISDTPARRQTENPVSSFAYSEGKDSFYNIWYHRQTLNQYERNSIIEPSRTICKPTVDVGYTLADNKRTGFIPICIWFARGCCTKGEECAFRHRLPSDLDDSLNDHHFDIFGRKKFADQSADMGGVGSFLQDSRTLYVSNLISTSKRTSDLQTVLLQFFQRWGIVDYVRVVSSKNIAFVRFKERSCAEFAKVASQNQPLADSPAIDVRWAYENT